MTTTIIVIAIVVVLVIAYQLTKNNYNKRMILINRGMEDIKDKDYAIVEVNPSLFLGTLKTEGYETYASPVSLAFLLDGEEILVMPTTKNNSLAITFSKLDDMSESKLEVLIEDN